MDEQQEDDKIKIRCEYCQEYHWPSVMVEVAIYENRGMRNYYFCKDKPCADYYQMGAEG